MNPIIALSPNFDRRSADPDMIVLHYTGMTSGEAALARLRDPVAKVSAHWLIEEDGRLFALVAEEDRAWHAGIACWAGERDINGASIGVEIVNPGHEFGYRRFPDVQIAALIDLIGEIRGRWAIPNSRVLGHSDVAPQRKTDPGELFPWRALAKAGHGLWVEPPDQPGPVLAEGDEGGLVGQLRSAFGRLGYDCPASSAFDAAAAAIVRAFQRHWVQDRVDGRADGKTRARLEALLAL
ncbi:MAG: N-acetylmuramoyl-L-alanine amidase [Caulobacteraceae bacterium]